MRRSGIAELGDVPLGTHVSHFFETTADVYDTAARFLAAGLEEGERCLWLLAEPLSQDGAREALRRVVPDVDRQIAGGNVILQPALAWYLHDGEIDEAKIDDAWTRLLGELHERGSTGLRVAGCVSWVTDRQWAAFREIDAKFDERMTGKPMIVICSFPLSGSDTGRLLDVAQAHQFALTNRDGRTEVIETPVFRMRQLDLRNRRQLALSTLGVTAVRERDLGVLMQHAVTLAAQTLGTGRGIVWQLRPEAGDMILHTRFGWEELPPDATLQFADNSVISFVLSNDQPAVVVDVPNGTRFQSSWILRDFHVATLLTAIIRGRTQPWGLLSVHSMTQRAFDAEDVQFLQSMADILALAVERTEGEEERARLLTRAETALARLDAIQRITDTALGHMGLDNLLAELLSRLRTALQADHTLVLLLDEPRTHLVVRAIEGYASECVAAVRVPADAALSSPVLEHGRAMIFDPVPDPAALWTAVFGVLIRAAMAAPLVVEGKIIGVVTVTSMTGRKFSEEELELLRMVADRVAPAIERARLTETVRAGRERLASLSRRLLIAQEEERRRVAIELHDSLGQLLTAIRLNLAHSPPNVGEAVENVNLAMQSVRDLALDLRPAMLDDLGLPAAMRWYADRFARQTGVEAHVAVEEPTRLDPGVAIASFRVMQEALTNVARHASAKNVWLTLDDRDGTLELIVRDDGCGFDVAAASARAARGASLGLAGMEERASLAGGSLTIRSAPGAGTEIHARFPPGNAP